MRSISEWLKRSTDGPREREAPKRDIPERDFDEGKSDGEKRNRFGRGVWGETFKKFFLQNFYQKF